MGDTNRLAAARAFVRSCNVLLKQAALYGLKHSRSATQLDATWNELRKALAGGSKLALTVAGDKLLLDGAPLASGTAERSVAAFLAAAGIGRLDFYPAVTTEEFAAIIHIFSSAKPPEVLAKLKPELGKTIGNIRVLEFRVMDDSGEHTGLPAGAGGGGFGAGDFSGTGLDLGVLLSDPRKLLQLIGAASTDPLSAPSATAQDTADSTFQEGDVLGLIRWLTHFAGGEAAVAADPPSAHSSSGLQRALQKVLPAKPGRELRGALLMQLAEQVALHAVSETFQRRGLNVMAIQQMLDRMNRELDTLRKVLRSREEQMGRAGLVIDGNAEALDRQFWKGIPDGAKRKVLLSADAWVLPPHIIRSFVQPLLAAHGEDAHFAAAVLRNYCRFLDGDDHYARSKTASGIGKLADLYAQLAYLRAAVECVGEHLARDTAGELAPTLKESFVLLGQEAAAARDYRALDEWLYLLHELEQRDPALGAAIRPHVPVNERVPEMVRAAVQQPQPPEGLIEVLKRVPDPAARYVAEQFGTCSTRDEGTRLARVLSVLGPVSIDPVREMLHRGSPADAISVLGLLSMLDPDFLRQELPARLAKWTRAQQDAALRQISAAGTPERGSVLLDVIDCLDPFVLPLAIDEIGMAGNVSPERLIHMAQGKGLARELPYLQVKAIEALGRLGERSAAPLLTQLLTARTLLSWQQPREVRVVAAQSLQRIDAGAARQLVAASGFTDRELIVGPAAEVNPSWIRQRKYPRVRAENNLVASLASPGGASSVKVEAISLGGGLGSTIRDPQGLTEAALDLYIGIRKLQTQVFIRHTRPHEVSFEFVDISLDDRSRLRGFVAEKCRAAEPAAKLIS